MKSPTLNVTEDTFMGFSDESDIGLDDIDYILSAKEEITKFRQAQSNHYPISTTTTNN